MFTTIIIQPIFNLLVLIYALIPGHNFGFAIILFTILIRLLLWPLLKKQLHHAKAIRELAPELKKIKAQATGDRRKEQMLTMELYKEREVNPLGSLGIIIVQAVILIGLYIGLNRVIKNPQAIISFSYPALHHLSWMKTVTADIHHFDNSLFGVIDLHRMAVGKSGIYWPALVLVVGSAATQFFQSRQLMPKSQEQRSLRQILREAGKGKKAEQQEVNVAVGRSTMYILPLFIFIISINFAAALPLYWFTGSLVAVWQQRRILKEDVVEAEAQASGPKVTIRTKPKRSSTKKTRRKDRNRGRRR